MIRAETFCIAEESFLNAILRQKVESARKPLQNPVIPELCEVFYADLLQVSAYCSIMARRDDDPAILLTRRVAQHLPEARLFHGLLLPLVEYQQARMIARSLCANF